MAAMPIGDLFVLYMAFHIYLYIIAQISADIVLDVTKLFRVEAYCKQARDHLACVTGLPINFNGMTEVQQFHPFDPASIDWKSIREDLNFAVLTLDHISIGRRSCDMGPNY